MARLGVSFGDRMSPDLDLAWATVAARDVVWTGVLFSGAKDLLPSRPVRSAARSTPHRVGARRAVTSPIARTSWRVRRRVREDVGDTIGP